MAEATITHYKEFERERRLRFAKHVMQVVGVEVYGLEYGSVTTDNVTLNVFTAEEGSTTSATSGTEVKIDLDDEEWPRDEKGLMVEYQLIKDHWLAKKKAIGDILLGGVNEEEGAIVNVWLRQFEITAWYGKDYQSSTH